MRETEFVEQLRRQFPVHAPVATGIGDDGAVLTNPDGSQTVVVSDMLLDGVHFDVAGTQPELIGRKAIAVNLSDLAAMGCCPTAAFISLAVPGLTQSNRFLNELYRGIQSLSERFDFTIAGGDTNSWNGPFAINVSMIGAPFDERAILRSGAEPGDSLVVTGALGGSSASERHLSFEPRLDVARLLTRNSMVHAMIDISDGLAIDLHRLLDAGGTGGLLYLESVPVHDDVAAGLPSEDRLRAALSDGEDFELLMAMPPELVGPASVLVQSQSDSTLTIVGTVTEESGCRMIGADGDVSDLPEIGWQHG
ncbi:MAG: thiamine-phosphate kinase [Fuerstiella sp.]|nr:thiamine-phosphate kinase [Fuerstiella sp.]